MKSDRISVVLPAYNGIPYLHEAVASIMAQSSDEWRLIIIDDGSTDGTFSYIKSLSHVRVQSLTQENRGLAATLNRAISMCTSEYIARQDQDDISFPLRLQKQAQYLDANPEVAMVGTHAEIWDDKGPTSRLHQHLTDDASLKFFLLFNNPFVHTSVMIRRSVVTELGGYSEDKERQPPEDYELWSRVARKYKLANIPEVLVAYREVAGSMSRKGINPFANRLVVISGENISWATGRASDSPVVVALARLSHGVYEGIPREVRFSDIDALLNEAAQNIAYRAGVSPEALRPMLLSMRQVVRYQYWQYRTGGLLGRMTSSGLGLYVKKAAKKILPVIRS